MSYSTKAPLVVAPPNPCLSCMPLQHWLVCWCQPGLQPGSSLTGQTPGVIHWGWKLSGESVPCVSPDAGQSIHLDLILLLHHALLLLPLYSNILARSNID